MQPQLVFFLQQLFGAATTRLPSPTTLWCSHDSSSFSNNSLVQPRLVFLLQQLFGAATTRLPSPTTLWFSRNSSSFSNNSLVQPQLVFLLQQLSHAFSVNLKVLLFFFLLPFALYASPTPQFLIERCSFVVCCRMNHSGRLTNSEQL